ncbi:MAG TPA: aldose epimerase family protein [Thermomicrobiales bacterium]|nr:aldose epimerase family protein [Thermomicrobiales bacterium]
MASTVAREAFGEAAGRAIERWTLERGDLRVEAMTCGAIVLRLEAPGRSGEKANVVLGFPTLAGYVAGNEPFFGALAGRFANRITDGRFSLDGRAYQLARNNGPHHLHGGNAGFDKRVWSAAEATGGDGPAVRFAYRSPDGEEGYPGTLDIAVTYTLTGEALRIDYEATTDAPTILNPTQHAYFNLAGEGSGDVLGHRLRVAAGRFVEVDAALSPTGKLAPVDGTPFDFREPRSIGARIREAHPQIVIGRGYDHCLVFDRPAADDRAFIVGARVEEPGSGRALELRTDRPGVQFYAGGFLDGTLVGPGGRVYRQGDGFCLETQTFPDAPNRPEFPSPVLRPGETFRSRTEFAFSVAG